MLIHLQSRLFVSRARTVAVSLAAAILAACGGGGGGGAADGVLTVNLSYDGSAQLFHASTIRPSITGLGSHSPNCSLVSGTLPAGMALQSDCSISGMPLQSGTFPIVVRLGASGVSNQLDWNGSVLVHGPSVSYSINSTLAAGASYDFGPLNTIFWTPSPADTVTYSVASGALPPGLTVNPATGRISGTPTTGGTYTFTIGAEVVNAGRVATAVQQFPEVVTVNTPVIPYNFSPARVGVPFTATPLVPGGSPAYTFSATSLPAGLSINATTGVISGVPAALGNSTYRIDLATPAAGGGTFTTFINVALPVTAAVDISWSRALGTQGQPFSSGPIMHNLSTDASAVFVYAFAIDPASALPTGLLFDPTTGLITGAPTVAGSFPIRINVTVTYNGLTVVVPVDLPLTIS